MPRNAACGHGREVPKIEWFASIFRDHTAPHFSFLLICIIQSSRIYPLSVGYGYALGWLLRSPIISVILMSQLHSGTAASRPRYPLSGKHRSDAAVIPRQLIRILGIYSNVSFQRFSDLWGSLNLPPFRLMKNWKIWKNIIAKLLSG